MDSYQVVYDQMLVIAFGEGVGIRAEVWRDDGTDTALLQLLFQAARNQSQQPVELGGGQALLAAVNQYLVDAEACQ